MKNDNIERYKIALDIFNTESRAQQWLFNSHFVVHGIILGLLFRQINFCSTNVNYHLITLVSSIGLVLALLFLFGYYRASKIAGYRMAELMQLEKTLNNDNRDWEFFSGKAEKYCNPRFLDKSNEVIPFFARFKNKWIRYVTINIIIALYTYPLLEIAIDAVGIFLIISLIELWIAYRKNNEQKQE